MKNKKEYLYQRLLDDQDNVETKALSNEEKVRMEGERLIREELIRRIKEKAKKQEQKPLPQINQNKERILH